tara:strand:+ start:227 stop:454 length:228 start_codon:yes stop_codon:yes gene_type:complete
MVIGHKFFPDGLYVVTAPCWVGVTGNAGIHEQMPLKKFDTFLVRNGGAIIGARYTLPGELQRLLDAGLIEKMVNG